MNIEPLNQMRKQQKLALGLFLLAGFMGMMKVIGFFAVGSFPWYTEFILCGFMLCYWAFLTFKIKKVASDGKKDGTHDRIH
jgi:hypothetical protein